MNFEILMATMFRSNISDLKLSEKGITSNILIINQTNENNIEISNNAKMISCKERGSSKSRNLAIKNASGDICLIADDDVVYVPNYEKIILKAFETNPDADIITFQIMTPEGEKFKDNYLKEERWHSKLSILKCSSIEIAFRKNSINRYHILFDEEFGLGSRYLVHDENIFLMDCLKNGLKIKYIPYAIVIHPKESSGTNFNEFLIISKGAAFIRLYGLKGIIFDFIFAIKKYNYYKHYCGILFFLKLILTGSINYIKTHSNIVV